jgi:micrococcal nuclease
MKAYKKIIKLFLITLLVLVILLLRFTDEIGIDIDPADRFVIKKVIDGDSFVLAGGDKLRLLSVDTPEKDELYFEKAKMMVSEITKNKLGDLEYGNKRRDKYGRLLGYLYIDTIFVNKIILDSGLGYLYLFKDTDINNEKTKLLLKAQQKAIDNRIGIWSLNKSGENYYLNPYGSFRLHRPGCRSISENNKNHRKFENRFEAFYEGLSPCRNCKP